WPDANKILTFRLGLNTSVKKALSSQLNLPRTYPAFLSIVQQLSRSSHVTSSFIHQPQHQSNGDRMDTFVGALEIATLSPTTSPSKARSVSPLRRQQWRKEGACVRCGSNSHWVQQCLLLPTKDSTKHQSIA
ncbi:hypothetical protein K469DRAFT_557402, partial [Zopfia rhizophila CBS 207.26]